jgi:hypothetical protein
MSETWLLTAATAADIEMHFSIINKLRLHLVVYLTVVTIGLILLL